MIGCSASSHFLQSLQPAWGSFLCTQPKACIWLLSSLGPDPWIISSAMVIVDFDLCWPPRALQATLTALLASSSRHLRPGLILSPAQLHMWTWPCAIVCKWLILFIFLLSLYSWEPVVSDCGKAGWDLNVAAWTGTDNSTRKCLCAATLRCTRYHYC